MDELNRKFRAIDWAKLQRQARKVQASTASALKDLVMTDLENKVRAATADTSWGASGSDMMEIAQGTFNREDYALIMSIIWQRLGSTRWRCVYKALDILKFLLMHGSSRCLEEARIAQSHIQLLEHFRCIDPDTHKDEGENVRARAAIVVAMIADQAVLEEEREKSNALRAKIGIGVGTRGPGYMSSGGLSSDEYRYGARGGASIGNGYGSDYDYDYGSSAAGFKSTSVQRFGSGSENFNENSRYDRNARSERSNHESYDEEPRGRFAALGKDSASYQANSSTVSQSVDDLLGGRETAVVSLEQPSPELMLNIIDGDEDDDEFDPRAYASKKASIKEEDTDLATQMLNSLEVEEKPASSASSQTKTSLLVRNLSTNAPSSMEISRVASANSTPEKDDNPRAGLSEAGADDTAYGGLVRFDNIMLDKSTRVEPKRSIHRHENGATEEQPPKANETKAQPNQTKPLKKEVDPFADLLTTAKSSGVL